MNKIVLFEGEAIVQFRVYPKQMNNLLFAFCVLGHNDDRWAGDTAVSGSDKIYYWEEVSAGKTMTIVDRVTGCTNYLDSEKLMQGIRRWIERGEGSISHGKVNLGIDEFITDRNDPFIANRIIQYALFEEVIYE